MPRRCLSKKPRDQEVVVALYIVRHESHSTHLNVGHRTAMVHTQLTSGALRREWAGPRHQPSLDGASRVRVLFYHRQSGAISPGTTCCAG